MAIDDFFITEFCPEYHNLNLTHGPYDYFMEANQYLRSSSLVSNGSNTVYEAAQFIELLPGFQIELGANFEAKIDGCDGDPVNIIALEIERNK